MPCVFQFLAKGSGSSALPNDGVVNWLSRFPIPESGGLPLVGDADCRHGLTIHARLPKGFGDALCDRIPDFVQVVFDHAGFGENLSKLGGDLGLHLAVAVEQGYGGACGALIDGQNQIGHADDSLGF